MAGVETDNTKHGELLRAFEKAYNDKLDGWFENYHTDDVSWSGFGVWAPEGRELVAEELRELCVDEERRFPDRRMEIVRLVADGDSVAVDYEWSGTAAFDMEPLREGEVQRFHNILFLTLREGKVATIREYGLLSPRDVAASAISTTSATK